jgi:hypothetical protein
MDNPYLWLIGHADTPPAGSRLAAGLILVTFVLVVALSAIR